jgi:hypothetical protein
MDVEVRIDPAGDAPCQIGHCHPFVGLGWGDTAPIGTTDKTATGRVRQAPMRSLRPTGGCRVGDRARPTDRTQDSPRGRQPEVMSQTWPGHPPTRWPIHSPKWWITQRPTQSSLPGLGATTRHVGGRRSAGLHWTLPQLCGPLGITISLDWSSRTCECLTATVGVNDDNFVCGNARAGSVKLPGPRDVNMQA